MTMLEEPEPGHAPQAALDDDAVIRVAGLQMRYGSTDVLRWLDFTVRPGEVLALLGPNGAGKSTTVEILEGFRLPSAGRVEVLGADPARADERRRAEIGVIMQSWRDHANWRVSELFAHFGRYYEPFARPGRPRPFDVDELLALVRLAEQADQRVSSLSGGQRRRLDVAIGIVGRPQLLFLDEPTAGFDPQARHEFHELVHRLADVDGATILLTTDDLAEAEKLADRILILARGRIVAAGSAEQLAPPGRRAHRGAVEPRRGAFRARDRGRHDVRPRPAPRTRRGGARPRVGGRPWGRRTWRSCAGTRVRRSAS
jgi:ABC-2 type transport system ATP-binding protein